MTNHPPQISRFHGREVPLAAWLLLLVSAAVALVWSHSKLLSQDEIFVLQTDSVGSLRQLLDVQLHHPISLDPLFYHLLAFGSVKLFGANALAIRLPSMAGFLLFQLSLFEFMRVAMGRRTGLIALAFPMVTATSFYAAEGRPYGLLLGLLGLVMVCWQRAWRGEPRSGATPARAGTLTGLAVALALLLNTHYFAVLLLGPLFIAECTAIVVRRRIDWGRLTAIGLGCLGAAAAVPFSRPAGEFRQHYYNAGGVTFHAVTMAYRALFADFSHADARSQLILLSSLVLGGVLFLWLLGEMLWKDELKLPAPELVLLVALALLPFGGFLLARFVTHSIEVRYVLGAMAGIACLAAAVLTPLLETAGSPSLLPLGLAAVLVGTGAMRIRDQRTATSALMADLALPAKVKAAVLASPGGRLYIQNLGQFEVAKLYEPDPLLRERMTLVWSRPLELEWDGHDTVSLTAEHLTHFTSLPMVRYEDLRREPGDHVFVIFHSGWDWTDAVFSYPDLDLVPLGEAMDGSAVSIRLLPREPGAAHDRELP